MKFVLQLPGFGEGFERAVVGFFSGRWEAAAGQLFAG